MKKLSFWAISGLLLSISSAHADEVSVSAAASLKDALTLIGANFNKTQPDTKINFNFGSSGTLQKQIEAGAPADLFLSAADKNMDELVAEKEVDAATRRPFAKGDLVLIAPLGSKLKSIGELRLTAVQTLALGGPGVPAGDYARQTLNYLKLTDVVSNKIINGKDVRAVLTLVASGNADAGFVYRTDALTSKDVRIVATAPAKSHTPVHYPMAILTSAPNKTGATKFWTYLQSSKAKQVLKKFGFK